MPLTTTILNNLWQSGFCKALIEQLRHSEAGQAGGRVRIEITKQHIADGCESCYYANKMRSLEAEAAHRLGAAAVLLFERGGDIVNVPGFKAAFKETMERALLSGVVDMGILFWISRLIPERANKLYPYTETDDGSQAN